MSVAPIADMRTLRDGSMMGRSGTAGSETAGSELGPDPGLIELTLDKPSQLFHAFDPSPIGGRELDEKVEQFIVRSAQDNPARQYNLLVHVADEALFRDDAQRLSQAIRTHFAHRRDEEARAIRSLLRQGRQALAIGIVFLFVCGAAGVLAFRVLPPPVGSFVEEGLLIVGWVANWRPLEVFLYDWRPLRLRQKLYDALAQMEISFRASRESMRTEDKIATVKTATHIGVGPA